MTTVSTSEYAGTYVSDPAYSTVTFTVTYMGVAKFRASFDDVTIRITGDGDQVRCEGTIMAESISIRTPDEFRESVVYGAGFLDAKNHPEISFRCADITLHEDGTATAPGELTVKGVTKPFHATGTYQLPVEDPFGDIRAGAELTATLDRRDWDITWQAPMPKGGDMLGNELTVHIQLVLLKEA